MLVFILLVWVADSGPIRLKLPISLGRKTSQELPKHFLQPPCPFKKVESKLSQVTGNMYQFQVERSGQRSLTILPSQSQTQLLDVNKKHVIRPHWDHVPLLCYTFCCLPLAWPYHSLKKHKSGKDESLTSNCSRCSWYIFQIPLPGRCTHLPNAAGVGCN